MELRPDPLRSYRELKDRSAKSRLPIDKDVWLNVAFYLGEQYIEWADDVSNLRVIPRRKGYENTPRPVVNKIMHFVNQEHSDLLRDRPNPDVLPATDDPVDISESQVALAYLNWLSDEQVGDFDETLSRAAFWALVGGEGFIKWVYNPRLKRPDFLPVSPFDLYRDPYATEFRNSRYLIHSQFMDVEQVYELYGVDNVKPSAVQAADMSKVALLRDMGTAPVLEGVTVNELWMKPCRRYPQGVYCVWADSSKQFLVEPQSYPYKHGHLPFTQLGSIVRPGSQHYAAAVKFLRPAQMELNKYHAQKLMMREAFANLKWWVPAELELATPPDDSPMQILSGHSQGGSLKPEIIAPPSLPDTNDGQWIGEEMMNIVGLHEVSQAQVPGRVEAAKAIEMLKESDAGRQAELRRTIRSSMAEGFWQLLMLAKQYVPEEQIVQTYSRDGVPEVARFKAEKLQPGLRIRVTLGTGLSRSRAARQDELMLYWQNGIIRDPEVIAELLEVPVPTFVSQKAFDIRLARNENYTIAGDTAIEPNSWDDHGTHLREHNNYRKTHEFLTASDAVKTKFEHHCTRHEELELNELGKMVQKQQMVAMLAQGGAPPDAGGPPGEGGQPADQRDTPQAQAEQQSYTAHNLAKTP